MNLKQAERKKRRSSFPPRGNQTTFHISDNDGSQSIYVPQIGTSTMLNSFYKRDYSPAKRASYAGQGFFSR